MKAYLSICLASAMALAGCSQSETKQQDETKPPEKEVAAAPAPKKLTACPDFPADKDAEGLARPVKIPENLKDSVLASKTTLTVGHSDGQSSCVDISSLNVASINDLAKGRALGVGLEGVEYNSYLVFDRLHKGKGIETGFEPNFAPSGQKFASIDASESAFGAFESFGAWKIDGQAIVPIAVRENGQGFDITGQGADWKVTGWSKDENCVSLSAGDVSDPEAAAKRKAFHVSLAAKPINLQPGACP